MLQLFEIDDTSLFTCWFFWNIFYKACVTWAILILQYKTIAKKKEKKIMKYLVIKIFAWNFLPPPIQSM